MKKEIQNYNESYIIDLNTVTNDPNVPESERLKQLQNNVTIEQMKTCKCTRCFDTGATNFLFVDEQGETRLAYALCTCDAIKNVVH
jgi:hypothetical protein